MSSIAEDLARALEGVQRAGDFFATGTREILPPGLEVEGVGPIALPLIQAQADQLVAAASRAPYGRGAETLVDTDVRRTWEIDAGKIGIRGRAWPATLASIVQSAAEGLGVEGPSRPNSTSCWSTTKGPSSSGIAAPRRAWACSPPW